MTRFDDDGGDWDYGRYMLWETAQANALAGKRGQKVLADLEAALLDLPEKRLISGRMAENGQVCAVGALVLKRRVEAGEPRLLVLRELEHVIDEDGYNGADITASQGHAVGVAYSLAWRLAELNDEDCRDYTPEQRYEAVLRWVRKAQGKPAAASA